MQPASSVTQSWHDVFDNQGKCLLGWAAAYSKHLPLARRIKKRRMEGLCLFWSTCTCHELIVNRNTTSHPVGVGAEWKYRAETGLRCEYMHTFSHWADGIMLLFSAPTIISFKWHWRQFVFLDLHHFWTLDVTQRQSVESTSFCTCTAKVLTYEIRCKISMVYLKNCLIDLIQTLYWTTSNVNCYGTLVQKSTDCIMKMFAVLLWDRN